VECWVAQSELVLVSFFLWRDAAADLLCSALYLLFFLHFLFDFALFYSLTSFPGAKICAADMLSLFFYSHPVSVVLQFVLPTWCCRCCS
jgi:hypothetical protein